MNLKELREVLSDEETRSISRRYFFSNGFDGTLTAVGVSIGSYLSGVPSGMTVFQVGMGAMIGLATSGVWSVWEIERAEKIAEIRSKEDAMLMDLDDTEIKRKEDASRKVNAVMSGLGPIVSVLVCLSPFLLPLSVFQAAIGSVIMASGLLFGFGAYMGKISRQKWYIAGLRMGLAGIAVAVLNLVLPG